MTTALLLVNPNSRSGNSNLNDALKLLRDANFELIELKPDSREGVSEEIINHAGKADLVIVGGGDGTVNAAIRGAMESGLTMAVLPLGTANDFARTLKIPTVLAESAAAIIDGRTAKIDVGQLNEHHFLNVAHIGLAVDVARTSNSTEKKFLSVFAYVLAMFRALKHNRRFRAKITYDGKTLNSRCNHVSVGSGRNYGGGMVVSEKAKIDDGMLDLFTWRRRSIWRLLWAAIKMRQGRHIHLKEVTQRSAKKISIATDRLLQVAADGELLDKTPVEFSCLPKAITVIVGKEFQANET